jgi:hypothetical protein
LGIDGGRQVGLPVVISQDVVPVYICQWFRVEQLFESGLPSAITWMCDSVLLQEVCSVVALCGSLYACMHECMLESVGNVALTTVIPFVLSQQRIPAKHTDTPKHIDIYIYTNTRIHTHTHTNTHTHTYTHTNTRPHTHKHAHT